MFSVKGDHVERLNTCSGWPAFNVAW